MKLLVTGAWNGAPEYFDMLSRMGHEILWMPDERSVLPSGAEAAEGIICNGLFLVHPPEAFPALRFVQLTSAGFDRVPLDELRDRGIEVRNARGVYSIPMAEFALCAVLQMYKQCRFFLRNQEACRWEKHRGLLELYGKTVTIVGTGSVGTECAIRFRAFGCRVLGINIRPRPALHFDRVYSFDQMNDVLSQTDVLLLAVPLTEQTRYLMNADRFRAMKPGAILVNLSRGAVVDTQALIAALDSRLGGAALDVFEQEPLAADSPLWKKDNVLLTPHNSFVGEGNRERLCQVIMSNLASF